jgi:NADPH:quinone reductase-like Zn-dependent oxidoreductase
MRQIWIPKTGGPEVLEVREAPDPLPQHGEIRVRVERAGINFADIMARLGLYPDAPKLPAVVGYEVSGVIDAVGEGVSSSRVGQRVLAFSRFGGYSDVLCVPEAQALSLPEAMTFDEAAAIPVNYITAYQLLLASGSVVRGDKVLIHQAAGGVGLAALDICKIIGAETYGTASGAKHDFLRERGLDHPIDYTRVDFAEEIRRLTGGKGVNLVLDPIGGDSWRKGWEILRPTGRLIMFGFSSMTSGEKRSLRRVIESLLTTPWFKFNPLNLMNANKGIIGVNLGHMWEEVDLLHGWMAQILRWYQEGKIHPHVDRIFRFDEAGAAHTYIQERRNIGKILLRP